MYQSKLCWGLLLLLLVWLPWLHAVRSLDVNVGGKEEASRVLVALSYPSVRIGPYNWRYFRVEVPPAFAELSISLTRKWTGEHIGNYEGNNVPMVCFRFGSPPLPDSVLESPQAAAVAAGEAENPIGTGKCAWFQSNSSVALTNMQIVAGVWYVGVFSEPQPSRFQSKMISRGSIFTFGIHFTVLGCKSPNLRGHDCSVAVKPLCYEASVVGSTSEQTSLGAILPLDHRNGMPHWNPPISNVAAETWTSLKSQHVGPNEWKHFALEVTEFSLSLQVRVNGTGLGVFYLKYGALPDDGDNGTVINSAPISVSVPRRGPWYIGVRNSDMDQALDFDLYWHVESRPHDAAVAVNSMERVLVEDAQESPFNSFYGLVGEEALHHNSPWFFLSDVTHIGNATSGNWTYFFIDIPRGAAGAVLSVQLRHVVDATMSVYARLEGLATPDHWDVKTMNVEDKEKRRTSPATGSFSMNPVEVKQEKSNNKLSLDLVYPTEGIWCIGVHYMKHVHSVQMDTNVENAPQQLVTSTRVIQLWRKSAESFVQWYQSFVEWVKISWRDFRSTVYSFSSRALEQASVLPGNLTNRETDIEFFRKNSGPSLAKQPLVELASKRKHMDTVQMQIRVHGCVNKCSGKGHCVTRYESSRLHFISNCHCDAAHGGIDCGVSLLVPREETLHVWALIGSNSFALLPSFWAIRHHAYSEWVSYVASGVSSGFYHSCDAGGWCVLSYDTLQVAKLLPFIGESIREIFDFVTNWPWLGPCTLHSAVEKFLDFWLSFLVVIMTCLSVASLKHVTKAVAHVTAAIITAAITKENATNAWNVLLVVLMGLAGLLLGWALECWRLRLLPSWLSAISRNIRPRLQIISIYHFGEQLLGVIIARFQWFYLSAGLGILLAAGLSWFLETADTYWIWHSLWHVSIYSSAFLVLCSTSKSSWTPSEDTQGYERTDLQPPSDPEASPLLSHTVELDGFANDRDRASDD